MSQDGVNQNSIASDLKSALIFPAIMQGGGAFLSVRRAGSIQGAIEAAEIKNFKKLNSTLKKTAHKDIFSRGVALSDNYEKYKRAYVESTKLSKQIKKGKISKFERFKNLFKNKADKTTLSTIKNSEKSASKKLKDTKKILKKGKEIAKTTSKSGLKNTTKKLLKKELTSKFNLALSGLTTFVPAMMDKVIPAFKEQGLFAGIKETGKALVQTGVDFVSYGIGGAIGRTLGTALGTIICPGAGSFIGGNVGDAIGSMLIGGKICKATDKAMGNDDEQEQMNADNSETAQIQQKQLYNQIADNQAQNATTMDAVQQELSYKEARAKYGASSNNLAKKAYKSGYIQPKNGVYATSWVNDMNKEQKKFDSLA